MSIWLVVLWWYLGVGAINYTAFAARGLSMLFSHNGNRSAADGLVEAAFYVLLWPVQMLFWALIGIHNGTGWVLEKIMG